MELGPEDHGFGAFGDSMNHGELRPNEHGEKFGRQLQGSRADKPSRLLADPDEHVGVAVEDVYVLGVKVFLFQPVLRYFDLRQLEVTHAKADNVKPGNKTRLIITKVLKIKHLKRRIKWSLGIYGFI